MYRLALIVVYLSSLQMAVSQTIAVYSGTSTPEATTVSNLSSIPLTRGSGLNPAGGAEFRSFNWTTSSSLDTNDYIEWTLTADAEFSFEVSSITINYDRDLGINFFGLATGPTTVVLRSSIDNFSSDIYADTNVSTDPTTITIPIVQNSAVGGSITYRLYGYNSQAGFFGFVNNGTLDIEGGLGTALGLSNVGISLTGLVRYDGLYYNGTSWTPNAPNLSTGAVNALVEGGNPIINTDAQVNNLTVSPGANLFIEEGIGLIINGDLRVEGALELNSVSDRYSSLIVNGATSGEVTYFRHVNQFAASGTSTGNNDLISAPVTSSSQDFLTLRSVNPDIPSGTIGGVPAFLFGPFDNDTNSYVNYTATNDPDLIEPGIGYRTASVIPGGSSFRFQGEVATNSIAVGISIGSGSIFNLIGNPYPSYLDLQGFLAENNAKLDATRSGVYGYDGDATDGFVIWNQAYSDANPGALIAPGQGFLIASDQANATINFLPSMRRTGSADDFIPGRPFNIDDSIQHLKLKLEQGSQTYFTDIYFTDNATAGMDAGYDSALYGAVPQVALYTTVVDGNFDGPLGIQSLNYDAFNGVSIPLGVHANAGQQLLINIEDTDLPDDIDIYLEDRLLNTQFQLTSASFTMSPTSNLDGDSDRFFLNFESTQLSVETPLESSISITSDLKSKEIKIIGFLDLNTQVQLYDVQGRRIYNKRLSTPRNEHYIDVLRLKSGVYIVKVSNHNGFKSQKVIID